MSDRYGTKNNKTWDAFRCIEIEPIDELNRMYELFDEVRYKVREYDCVDYSMAEDLFLREP